MTGQQTSSPSHSGSPPSHQSSINPSAPPVNGTSEGDTLRPPSPPNNAQNLPPPTNLQPKTKLIILASILSAILGALIQYTTSSIIFVPAGTHWLGLERSEHCERYGTRKYRAKLGPFTGGYDRLKACRTTKVEIHGRRMKPTYCEDMGTDHGVWGNWIVNFNEGGCRPSWEEFTDKGCTAPGSGFRRIEARLVNFRYEDGWDIMCSSTPIDFNGLHFDGAMACVNKGSGLLFGGVIGSWDIGDGKCRKG